MAETTALEPVHADCPTCACGKRAPVVPGGSVAWSEHEQAWAQYAALNGGNARSAQEVAEAGGFSIGQLTEYLGGQPTTWRATPAERVPTDFVEVVQDAAGEWRWHRKSGNGEIVADSGEGYANPQYAIKMASRINLGVEIRVPKELHAPIPPRPQQPEGFVPAAPVPTTEPAPEAAAGTAGADPIAGASPLDPPAGG